MESVREEPQRVTAADTTLGGVTATVPPVSNFLLPGALSAVVRPGVPGAYRPPTLTLSGNTTPTTVLQAQTLQPMSPRTVSDALATGSQQRVSPYKPVLAGAAGHVNAPPNNTSVVKALAFPLTRTTTTTPSGTPEAGATPQPLQTAATSPVPTLPIGSASSQKYNPIATPPRDNTPAPEPASFQMLAVRVSSAATSQAPTTDARAAPYNPLQRADTSGSGSGVKPGSGAGSGLGSPTALPGSGEEATSPTAAGASRPSAAPYNPLMVLAQASSQLFTDPHAAAAAAPTTATSMPIAPPPSSLPMPVMLARPALPVFAALSAAAAAGPAATATTTTVATLAAGAAVAASAPLLSTATQSPSAPAPVEVTAEQPTLQEQLQLSPAGPSEQMAPAPAPAPPSEDEALQMRQAELLHELVGGKFDTATCRDVLAQLGGDIERAAHFILDGHHEQGGAGDPDPAGNAAVDLGRLAATDQGAHALEDGFSALQLQQGSEPSGSAVGLFARQEDPWHTQQAGDGGAFGGWDVSAEPQHEHGADGARGAAADVAAAMGGGTWEDCAPAADPWACETPPATGPSASGGQDASGGAAGMGELASTAAATPNRSGPSSPRGTAFQSDADDSWAFTEGELEEGCEDQLEELRIYFPHLDEGTLRETLAMLGGNVPEALQLLSELHEEEMYRRIEMERQAEADAALARRLAEQHSASPGGPGTTSLLGLGLGVDSAAEDYVLNAAGDIAEQMSQLAERERREAAAEAEARSRANSSGDARSGRERWGMRLLVRVFGPHVDEELLSEVLATHDGDVEAARGALRSMGLEEQPQKQQQQQQGRTAATTARAAAVGPAAAAAAAPLSGEDALAWPAGTAAGAGSWEDEGLVADAPLVSRRVPSQRAIAAGNGSGGGGGAGMRRRSGTDSGSGYYPAAAPVLGGAELPSNAAVLGPPRLAAAAAFEDGRSSAVGAAGAVTAAQAAGASASAAVAAAAVGGGAGGTDLSKPIRLLATVGLDCRQMNLSDDALQVVRNAFWRSPLPALFQQSGASSAQELLDQQRASQGRYGGGLTHEEKQALWGQHRELPLALKAMRDLLRTGSRAVYHSDAPDGKRLARELKEVVMALEPLIRDHHRTASHAIYRDINAALQQEWKTDLHALLPDEAMEKLDEQLRKLIFMGGGYVNWLIITGKGLHSRGDGPKLPAMVDDWLARRGLTGLPQPGAVMVRLTPEVFDRLSAAGLGGGGGGGASGSAMAGGAGAGV